MALPPPMDVVDDTDTITIFEAAVAHISNDRNTRESVKDFFPHTISRLSEKEFQSHFRLTKSSFEHGMVMIATAIHPKDKFEKKMLLFLRYLATQETLQSLSMTFDVAISTAWSWIRQIMDALKGSGFVSGLICFPDDLH